MAPDEYSMWLERESTGRNLEELTKSYELLIQKVKRVDPLTIAEETDAEVYRRRRSARPDSLSS